ncbi:MAG: glutamate--tRNA ligase [Bacteroidota bacterium]
MEKIRVRFAPSPTGALHIGGVRTALYNYLLAKKLGGTFILRIEDTDQMRYVPGAEDYIIEALAWCGLTPDEGPGFGGDHGPYRQSERKALYQKFAQQLVDTGHAYYAFDTPEELDAKRQSEKEKGNHTFKYDSKVRHEMRNSESLDATAVKTLLDNNTPYTIRLKVPINEVVTVHDQIRGAVSFQSNELDDKILMKADGMPTYHLANIVDDHHMEITHVIRGEEWLPSTAHHILLYQAFGWEGTMPQFAHLPLILKPHGNGKLSKRDGAKLGIPVFPLSWKGATPEDSFEGFREFGFDPNAVINFLAFLGWNPGTEQEMFSKEELVAAFSIENIGKAGARFDFDKAKWFNQQYIIATPNEELAAILQPMARAKGYDKDMAFLTTFAGLMKERVLFYTDFLETAYYFFEPVKAYDQKTARKKWKSERRPFFEALCTKLEGVANWVGPDIKEAIVSHMEEGGLKFGDVLPIVRVGVCGTMKGPDIFETMQLLGKQEVVQRLHLAFDALEAIAQAK